MVIFILPMDETLIMCAIDLSGRPYLGFESTFTADSVGYFDTQMVKESSMQYLTVQA